MFQSNVMFKDTGMIVLERYNSFLGDIICTFSASTSVAVPAYLETDVHLAGDDKNPGSCVYMEVARFRCMSPYLNWARKCVIFAHYICYWSIYLFIVGVASVWVGGITCCNAHQMHPSEDVHP